MPASGSRPCPDGARQAGPRRPAAPPGRTAGALRQRARSRLNAAARSCGANCWVARSAPPTRISSSAAATRCSPCNWSPSVNRRVREQTWDSPTCRQTRASTSSAVSCAATAWRRSVCWNGRRRRSSRWCCRGARHERRSLRGGALPLVPRAPGGGRRLAPPVPSERDRLRHQPMPDEAAQSLRVDLSPWSCGMVFSELLGADLTRFGLCYLAPAEVPASDLTRLGRRLREEFPLLDSQVDSGAEGFELVVHGQPEESPALEVGPSPTKTRSSQRCCNARIPCSSAACCDCSTGAAEDVRAGASGCITWSPTPTSPACCWPAWPCSTPPHDRSGGPEFGFLQQQWRLERQLRRAQDQAGRLLERARRGVPRTGEPALGGARQPLRGFPLGRHARRRRSRPAGPARLRPGSRPGQPGRHRQGPGADPGQPAQSPRHGGFRLLAEPGAAVAGRRDRRGHLRTTQARGLRAQPAAGGGHRRTGRAALCRRPGDDQCHRPADSAAPGSSTGRH